MNETLQPQASAIKQLDVASRAAIEAGLGFRQEAPGGYTETVSSGLNTENGPLVSMSRESSEGFGTTGQVIVTDRLGEGGSVESTAAIRHGQIMGGQRIERQNGQEVSTTLDAEQARAVGSLAARHLLAQAEQAPKTLAA